MGGECGIRNGWCGGFQISDFRFQISDFGFLFGDGSVRAISVSIRSEILDLLAKPPPFTGDRDKCRRSSTAASTPNSVVL